MKNVSKQIVIKKILFHSNYVFFLHNFSVLFSANISKIAGQNCRKFDLNSRKFCPPNILSAEIMTCRKFCPFRYISINICIKQLKFSELVCFKVKFTFIIFFLVVAKSRYTCKCNFKNKPFYYQKSPLNTNKTVLNRPYGQI